MDLVLPICNAHPYFSFKNLGKNVCINTQQNTISLFVVRTFRIYPLSYLHIHNTVLSTVVTILYQIPGTSSS